MKFELHTCFEIYGAFSGREPGKPSEVIRDIYRTDRETYCIELSLLALGLVLRK